MSVLTGMRCKCLICRHPSGSKCDHQLLIESKRENAALLRENAELRANNARLREALEGLPCNVLHQGYPKGTTCLDCRRMVLDGESSSVPSWIETNRNNPRRVLCDTCFAKQALAEAPAASVEAACGDGGE